MQGSKRSFLLMYMSSDVDDWDMWFLGRASRTRETLPCKTREISISGKG